MAWWIYTVDLKDVFHNEELTFEQSRDAIVERLCASRWYQEYIDCEDPVLPELVDELAVAEAEEAFNDVFGAIYDVADVDLAWIATF